jgi:hypothetical protein
MLIIESGTGCCGKPPPSVRELRTDGITVGPLLLTSSSGALWLASIVALIYLALIVLLACIAVFSSRRGRQRDAERVLGLLWAPAAPNYSEAVDSAARPADA